MNKGDYGYMNQYKKNHIMAVIVYAVLIAALVLFANLIDSKLISPICYVVAIVCVLPAAKHFVAVVVVFPFHTLDEVSAEDLNEHTRPLRNGLTVYDVTLASVDGIMYSPYIYITKGIVYCLVINTTAKLTLEMVERYVDKILKNAGLTSEVRAIHNISEMNRILETLVEQEDTNMELLRKIKDELLIYNV